MRIGVIGDIHGNLAALERAHATLQLRGIDHLVFMGDLLTYGASVVEIIDFVAAVCAAQPSTLLAGNHEQYYLRADSPEICSVLDGLPAWIRESIEYTRTIPGVERLESLPFVDSFSICGTLFSHANPFGKGDWRYLRSEDEYRLAAISLLDRPERIGVFAHTHRCQVYRFEASMLRDIDWGHPFLSLVDGDAVTVMNTGSVGQPRNQQSKAVYVQLLEYAGKQLRCEYIPFEYDVERSVRLIAEAPLSSETRHMLCSFLR